MFATKELVLTGRRAVVALVIAWSVASTDAGEQRRGKVFFSDPKELPPVPAGTPRPPLQLTPGEVIPRGGSLDGVTAPPFASPALIPQTFRPLPKRATADDDKDWLVKSVEKMNVGGDAIAKALGVRDYGPSGLLLGDDGENELLRKENSFLGNALRGTGLPGAGGDNGPDR
ncbi:MAG: hypothetical protein N3G20_00920 [Verrucomicrobiae bacterium]|nr:hypothetical protein [Verrucomicrobiae bacterium]